MNTLTQMLQSPPQRIVVFRALKLGDLLCSVPAFRALRRAFPQAHIALLSLPWAADFVRLFPAYFDEFISFPGWPGLPEQPVDPAKTVAFLAQMQARQWDVALQMQGNGTFVNAMLSLFGARLVAGYYPQLLPAERMGSPDLWMPYPQPEHEVIRHVQLMEFLGLTPAGYELEFPATPTDFPLPDALNALHEPYVCIHAGGISGRRWPAEQFAQVADRLATAGLPVVLTGTGAESPIAQTVQQHMHHRAVDLTGQTDLPTLAAVLRQSVGLVSNDTGVSHLATACQVPSVVIFTSADPAEWAPLATHRHRAVREADTTPTALADLLLSLVRDRVNHPLTPSLN
ncbi:glycosyltransferase family 9 protein [Rudanella paleaurantiibacter]|uniref:Glycosyltransferase family 9 protein n=1 Tax=Rudanella paleaurantiibacter TaxID=2614655 RepID=A0A7J5U6E2_9BACT|nr:glycosyltransferase family 9 protein [Rudanella paleaurantiibacter]KAB7733345.1 glycosyltransferase family 9 protein [Rudanella paleaurantiibacter]